MARPHSKVSAARARNAALVHERICLSPGALKDLDEIWEYIAGHSIDAADRVRDEIYDAIKSLVPFPYVGHQRPDLRTSARSLCDSKRCAIM
jgi:plasmid stabilization system protein ParE